MNNTKKDAPKWFRKSYKKFKKLTRKRKTDFIGLGMMPISKGIGLDFEVWKILNELIKYEPFLDFIRKEVFNFDD